MSTNCGLPCIKTQQNGIQSFLIIHNAKRIFKSMLGGLHLKILDFDKFGHIESLHKNF